jgi:hypothetical protein
MFDWDETMFTRVTTVTSLLASAASHLLLPLLSAGLCVPDALLGGLACLLTAGPLLVTALASLPGTFIFAGCLGLAGPMVSSIARSLLSKRAAPASLGSLYSVLGCLEAVVPLAADPLLTLLYNSSLPAWPGAVFLARALALGLAGILSLVLAVGGGAGGAALVVAAD